MESRFSHSQMAANVLGGKHPGRMTFIPFQISACEPTACAIEDKILSECQIKFLNGKPDIRAAERGEILASEVLEAACRQVPHVSGIGVGIMGAEMRRHDENIRAIARDAVNLRHGARYVADVLDDMRHVDALERVVIQRPGKLIQIPDDIGGGSRVNVDANGPWLRFTGTATDIQNRQSI
jgi:hypothetical protein